MDWTSVLIGAVIGALVSIPFGIFGNIATPWVRSYFEKRSLTTKERRIYILQARYRYISNIRKLPFLIIYSLFKSLAWSLAGIIFIIMFVSLFVLVPVSEFGDSVRKEFVRWMTLAMISVVALFSSYMLTLITTEIEDVIGFDKYREKTIAKLIKLGGDPEDLDKEEG